MLICLFVSSLYLTCLCFFNLWFLGFLIILWKHKVSTDQLQILILFYSAIRIEHPISMIRHVVLNSLQHYQLFIITPPTNAVRPINIQGRQPIQGMETHQPNHIHEDDTFFLKTKSCLYHCTQSSLTNYEVEC